MSATFRLDRARRALFDANGQRFDAPTRSWHVAGAPSGEAIDAINAATWLQRDSGSPIRVPVGVIGPREATLSQLQTARDVGAGLADIGFAIVCGGRHGVMEAVCEGAASHGGISVGLLPDADPSFANPFVSIVVATGIGEARNALITRASLCLVAIGDSYGTLSEVALGRQFGKLVIGVDGAANVDGVVHVANASGAIERVARFALAVTT
jgi:uncharacterized protein (TIGR00725 family)